MDDADGVLNFDFEGGLDASHVPSIPSSAPLISSSDQSFPTSSVIPSPSLPPGDYAGAGQNQNPHLMPGRRSFRQTVCRHWLRGLCMKGEACGFLHQYDKARMPVCRFFRLYGECREQDCVYKHTNEDIKECNMYKLGFCPNGTDCRYRHAKLPGPPPLVEEVFQKIQHLSSFNYNPSNRFFQQRSTTYNQTAEKPQFPLTNAPAVAAEVTGRTSAGMEPATIPHSQTLPPSHPSAVQQPQQQVGQNQMQNHSNGFTNQPIRTAVPLPPGRSRYFIVKSCNRENLELSVQQGVWATQRSNEAKLNEAFETTDNVILIFSINRTRHFQGCAKMTSKIGGYVGGGNWKYAHGTPHYGRNFSIKWLKLGELSFHKTRHLRNPYNDNLPVKISRDCQELDPFVGPQLASLLYDEPDSELWVMQVASESKREEEKVKGVIPDDVTGNPDIVPFDDNEEEEEEESEEEEEEEEENMGVGAQMRGRGRGVMWPPHMPMIPGGRPMLGVRGFPPVMMSPDGFSFGGVTPDGFSAPDIFGPRMFAPYGGPRFPGDLSGLVFPGRPTQPGPIFPGGGLGMMMGANAAPFMGGMAMGGPNAARPNRPLGMQQFRMPPPPLPPINRAPKRDQRRIGNDRGDRYESGPDLSNKGMDNNNNNNTVQAVDNRYQLPSRNHYDDSGLRNNFHNDESESEDEAPRRSRKRESNEETASDR